MDLVPAPGEPLGDRRHVHRATHRAGHDLMGFWELRDRARKHIALREKNAPMVKMEAIEAKYQSENAELRRQLEELKALVSDQPVKRGPGRPPKIQEEAA